LDSRFDISNPGQVCGNTSDIPKSAFTPNGGSAHAVPGSLALDQKVAEVAGAGVAPVVMGVPLIMASTPTHEPVDVYTMNTPSVLNCCAICCKNGLAADEPVM
jgi:hypothetical protein